MVRDYDIVIIGTGAGGGTLAYGLRGTGARVLLIERGDYLPQEPENWDPEAVFVHDRYKADETWLDKHGNRFRPGIHYFVGGNTKVYGAALPRMRAEDFDALEHEGGTSPAWPIDYSDLASYYARAEKIYRVHADPHEDPTEPPRSEEPPYQAVPHEPYVADLSDRLRRQGLHPFHLPLGIDLRPGGRCIRCKTCDGFACRELAKSDADVSCVRPALERDEVDLMTRAFAVRLKTDVSGRRIASVDVERDGERFEVRADRFVVSCGAVNSAALLLRSGEDGALANASGQVGRNYMMHNNTALVAVDPFRRNTSVFQKTLAVNDFYLHGADWPYPMGNLQLVGKVQAPMLAAARPRVPMLFLRFLARRSVDWWVMSEDLPNPNNQVTLTAGATIQVHWSPNNRVAHRRLIDAAAEMMRAAGYPFVFTETMGVATNSHQCGTLRFGDDPAASVLDPYCRAHDIANLYVVDASVFPSSSAVNPALTIAAMALRVADHFKNTA